MIRELHSDDLEKLSDGWLAAVCAAHPSLPEAYWMTQLQAAHRKLALGAAAGHAHLDGARSAADGFVLVAGSEFLFGVFVLPHAQRRGAGSELMCHTLRGRDGLKTHVLEENLGGRYFLQKHGFSELERHFCADTGQERIVMCSAPTAGGSTG